MKEDLRPGRLRWKCRRGMRELDVLLTEFLEERYAALPARLKADFAALLELQDPELYALMLGRSQPEVELEEIVQQIRDFSSR